MFDCICCLCQKSFKSDSRLDSVCKECRYAMYKSKTLKVVR